MPRLTLPSPVSSLLFAAALALPGALPAADGDLDPTFWGDGKMNLSSAYDGNFRVGAVLAAPDGWNVVVATRKNRTSAPDALFWQRIGSSTLSTLCNFEPPGGATGVYDVFGTAAIFDLSGKLVVAFTVEYGAGNHVAAVARFLYPACTLDTNFDGDGYAVFDLTPEGEYPTAIDFDTIGRYYVAGAKRLADANQDVLLMRLLPGGGLDTGFSGNGWLVLDALGLARQDFANGLVVQPDGKPVVAGYADVETANFDFFAARFTLAGALDASFSGDGVVPVAFDLGGFADFAADLAYDVGSGRLAIVGSADAPGERRAAVAVLTPGGALDPSFSGDGRATFLYEGVDQSTIAAASFDGLGRLIATGYAYDGTSGPSDFGIARLLPGGTLDGDYSLGGSLVVPFNIPSSTGQDNPAAIALPSGRPVVAGWIRHPDNHFRPALVRVRTSLVFANGFETGGLLAWRDWY